MTVKPCILLSPFGGRLTESEESLFAPGWRNETPDVRPAARSAKAAKRAAYREECIRELTAKGYTPFAVNPNAVRDGRTLMPCPVFVADDLYVTDEMFKEMYDLRDFFVPVYFRHRGDWAAASAEHLWGGHGATAPIERIAT